MGPVSYRARGPIRTLHESARLETVRGDSTRAMADEGPSCTVNGGGNNNEGEQHSDDNAQQAAAPQQQETMDVMGGQCAHPIPHTPTPRATVALL